MQPIFRIYSDIKLQIELLLILDTGAPSHLFILDLFNPPAKFTIHKWFCKR
uniref:Uncharacterized protein n=1 Tax=Rhizophora mucronata TaxID=61149 RepID=A0A2P2P065_RHIMU